MTLHIGAKHETPMRNKIPIVGASKLNLGCGGDVRPPSQGWVNVDGFVDHPDVRRHDLAKFPYPFPSNSFDVVYASHVMEHIPTIFEEWNGTRRDILFTLMEEIHRILRPGGRFHIIVPLGASPSGLQNPQHYRQWRPEWFRYFDHRNGEFSQYYKASFELERLRYNRLGVRAPYILRMGPSRLGVFEHLLVRFPWLFGWCLGKGHEMEAILVALKPDGGRSPRPQPKTR